MHFDFSTKQIVHFASCTEGGDADKIKKVYVRFLIKKKILSFVLKIIL